MPSPYIKKDSPEMPPPSDNRMPGVPPPPIMDEPEIKATPSDPNTKETSPEPEPFSLRYETPLFLLLKKYDSPFVNKVLNRNVTSGEIQIKHPEFSNLLPNGKGVNHALLHVNYLPRNFCVDSESFSLYLDTFDNFIATHDECVTIIINDLINLLDPYQITVTAESAHIGGAYFRPTCRYVRKEE